MQGLRDNLLEFYELEHLTARPKELHKLDMIVNQMIAIRDYRDYLEKRMNYEGVTEKDVRLLDVNYARLDVLNNHLLKEIEGLQKL